MHSRARTGRDQAKGAAAVRPRRLSRVESRAETRERLLQAALRVFADGGYGGASVDRIASEAGFTKGAFYANFPSKESVFLELLARHMEREAAELAGVMLEAAQGERPVMDAIEGWLRQRPEDADWCVVAVELGLHARRSPAFAQPYHELHQAQRERLGTLLAELFARERKRPPADPLELAGLLKAISLGSPVERAAGPHDRAATGRLLLLVLRALLALGTPAPPRSPADPAPRADPPLGKRPFCGRPLALPSSPQQEPPSPSTTGEQRGPEGDLTKPHSSRLGVKPASGGGIDEPDD